MRETSTVHIVAGEPFPTKKAARERAAELEAEQADAYRAQVEELEAQAGRAAEILGRPSNSVALGVPPPPPPIEVQEDVEQVTAFEIHALQPVIIHGEQAEVLRIVQMGATLERDIANRELERLNTADKGQWVGPPATYEIVERAIAPERADEIEAAAAAALALERKAEAKEARR